MVQSQCLRDILLYLCQQLQYQITEEHSVIFNTALVQTSLCALYNVRSCTLSYQNIENENMEHMEMTVE